MESVFLYLLGKLTKWPQGQLDKVIALLCFYFFLFFWKIIDLWYFPLNAMNSLLSRILSSNHRWSLENQICCHFGPPGLKNVSHQQRSIVMITNKVSRHHFPLALLLSVKCTNLNFVFFIPQIQQMHIKHQCCVRWNHWT